MTKFQESSIEKIPYGGWPNCYRMSNSRVDLVITTDVGPRIIRFGFLGEHNEFFEMKTQVGQTGGDEWRIYGGHRLWHAPEGFPRTYFPDNGPVKFEVHDGFGRVVQPVEPTTGIQKEMDIHLATDAARVRVVHRLRNTNPEPVLIAPWALSVMAPGGVAIIPIRPEADSENHLLPTDSLSLWPYIDMMDPRWTWGRNHILLRQDPAHPDQQKIGAKGSEGWMAYARRGNLFVARFQHIPNATYPDFGCSLEAYTNGEFLEVETLGPLVNLAPGGEVEHIEEWLLFCNVPEPKKEADIRQHILPHTRGA